MTSIASRLVRVAASAAILVGASSALAAQDLPKKGTCGYLASMHYPFAYQYGADAGPGWGLNVLALLDFDTNTFVGNVVLINPAGPNSTQSQETTQRVPFTVSPGRLGAGSYTITASLHVDGGDHKFVWNVVPVNNGRTLLMQQGPGPFRDADAGVAGVCQF